MNKKLSYICILLSVCLLLTACASTTTQSPQQSTITTAPTITDVINGTTAQQSTQVVTDHLGNTHVVTVPLTNSTLQTTKTPTVGGSQAPTTSTAKADAEYNSLDFVAGFRRGVNMGNMLEAPNEGDWGQYFEDKYFKIIKERGFDFVRIPIKWSNHQTDWVIHKDFFERIDHIIDQVLKNDLKAIINIHHFDELNKDPDNMKNGLYKLWEQISQHYKTLPKTIAFEINNEPNDKMTNDKWIDIQNECIRIIRRTNPTRKIVVSAADWGGAESIPKMVLPKDKNLIMSFHYYAPMDFTHQGADWGGSTNNKLGVEWNGTEIEKMQIDTIFRKLRAWSHATQIPVLLGEFGAYNPAPYDSRVRWTTFVRETAEKYGFSWSYWEFCAGFGVYDKQAGQYYPELANALIPKTVNKNVGQKVTTPVGIAVKGDNTIGPVTFETAVDFLSYSWCGYVCAETDNGVIIHLGDIGDWQRVCFPLDIKDTGSGFSKNQVEFTFKNNNKSITDLCFNIEAADGNAEQIVHWIADDTLFGNGNNVKQNADGTTTVTLDISGKYSALKGKISSGLNLKVFIESVPDNSAYDGKGSMEVLSVKCK